MERANKELSLKIENAKKARFFLWFRTKLVPTRDCNVVHGKHTILFLVINLVRKRDALHILNAVVWIPLQLKVA